MFVNDCLNAFSILLMTGTVHLLLLVYVRFERGAKFSQNRTLGIVEMFELSGSRSIGVGMFDVP